MKTKITVIIDAMCVLDESAIPVTGMCVCIILCAWMIMYLGSVSCRHGDSTNLTGLDEGRKGMFTQGSAKYSKVDK